MFKISNVIELNELFQGIPKSHFSIILGLLPFSELRQYSSTYLVKMFLLNGITYRTRGGPGGGGVNVGHRVG